MSFMNIKLKVRKIYPRNIKLGIFITHIFFYAYLFTTFFGHLSQYSRPFLVSCSKGPHKHKL